MKGNITITKDRFLELMIESETLNRLEFGGVDNWEWYGESMNPDDRPDMDKFKEEEIIRISKL